jgi:hypothetical protein
MGGAGRDVVGEAPLADDREVHLRHPASDPLEDVEQVERRLLGSETTDETE